MLSLIRRILARTYALASNLPSLVLDALLSLPALLVSVRNSLLPIPPHLPYLPPVPPPTPSTSKATVNAFPAQPAQKPADDSPADSDPEVLSDTGSDADVESGAEGSGVGESWISLRKDEHQ
jgi:hypothetical protein